MTKLAPGRCYRDGVERRRLDGLKLTGIRALVRGFVFKAQLVLTAITAIALLAERHASEYDEYNWHSTFGETYGLPLLVITVMVATSVIAVRRPRLFTGLLAGVISLVGAIVIFGAMIVVHLLSQTTENAPGKLAIFLLIVLAPFGLIAMITEIVVRLKERRHLESSDPEFPTARVVTS